jgi:type II pantothenate kinase
VTDAIVGVDFGLSVTDAVLVRGGMAERHASLLRPGPASPEVLRRALEALDVRADDVAAVAVTGGRSRDLAGEPKVVVVDEPTAIGRGALAAAGVERALAVSCGTGTAMVVADAGAGTYRHVTGTPVGGGTLEGLGSALLGVSMASEIAAMASRGDASQVDTTLGEVLGGGLGGLPPRATAVSLGRLAALGGRAGPDDLAAGLTTMVAQTIGLLALNAKAAHGLPHAVFVGRVATLPFVRSMVQAVFAVYGVEAPLFPEGGDHAVALGAAHAAGGVSPANGGAGRRRPVRSER